MGIKTPPERRGWHTLLQNVSKNVCLRLAGGGLVFTRTGEVTAWLKASLRQLLGGIAPEVTPTSSAVGHGWWPWGQWSCWRGEGALGRCKWVFPINLPPRNKKAVSGFLTSQLRGVGCSWEPRLALGRVLPIPWSRAPPIPCTVRIFFFQGQPLALHRVVFATVPCTTLRR